MRILKKQIWIIIKNFVGFVWILHLVYESMLAHYSNPLQLKDHYVSLLQPLHYNKLCITYSNPYY